jgi:hypothetical protein
LRTGRRATLIEGSIARDAQQPTAEGGRVLEITERAPRREERVLHDVGRDVLVAGDAEREVVDAREPTLIERPERVGIAGARGGDQRGVLGARGVVGRGVVHDLLIVVHAPLRDQESKA